MKCQNCDSDIDKKFNFCPICGERIRNNSLNKILDYFNKEIKNLMKFTNIDNIDQNKHYNSMILIRIPETAINKKMINSLSEYNTNKKNEETDEQKTLMNVKEPVTNIKNSNNRVSVKIHFPGVKKSDIEIKKLSESIEIRAIGKKESFFKIVEMPKNMSLVEKSFSNENLTLTFSLYPKYEI